MSFPGGAMARFPTTKEEGDDGKEENFVKGGVAYVWEVVDGLVHQRRLSRV